jgi:CHASE3 domain sensor protein
MSDSVISSDEISALEKQLQSLSTRRDKLVQTKAKLEVHVDSKKAELAQHLKEIRALGSDPETIDQDISKLKSVVEKKISVLNEDFDTSERLFENALKHIG